MPGAPREEPDNRSDDGWEQHADWWVERFTDGADPEYVEQILPLADEELEGFTTILDLGCGDGQVARRAASSGATVVGVDAAWNLVRIARRRGGGPSYVRAPAERLPFPGHSFDAVVACLVFEHIDEVDAALEEVARVLCDGGRCCLFLNHPLIQAPGSGWIDDHTINPPEQYWRLGPYLTETSTIEQVELGVWIRFVHRPISRYLNAAIAAGLTVERMVEEPPPPGFLARAPEYEASAAYPRLLYMRLAARR